jgi:hypothetical protein
MVNKDGHFMGVMQNGKMISTQEWNKQFEKQERILDLDLGYDFWKYRYSDAVIGRFWAIDPLSEKYAYNSVYAFQENKLGLGVELEGLELGPFPVPALPIIVEGLAITIKALAASTVGAAVITSAKNADAGAGLYSPSLGMAMSTSSPGEMTNTSKSAEKSANSAEESSNNTPPQNENNTGRGKNHLKPDPNAKGDHSTFRTDPKTGKTTNTATYKLNEKNPKTGFDEVKGVDVVGGSHRSSKTGKEINTPHVHTPKQKDPRHAKPDELPRQ